MHVFAEREVGTSLSIMPREDALSTAPRQPAARAPSVHQRKTLSYACAEDVTTGQRLRSTYVTPNSFMTILLTDAHMYAHVATEPEI